MKLNEVEFGFVLARSFQEFQILLDVVSKSDFFDLELTGALMKGSLGSPTSISPAEGVIPEPVFKDLLELGGGALVRR